MIWTVICNEMLSQKKKIPHGKTMCCYRFNQKELCSKSQGVTAAVTLVCSRTTHSKASYTVVAIARLTKYANRQKISLLT